MRRSVIFYVYFTTVLADATYFALFGRKIYGAIGIVDVMGGFSFGRNWTVLAVPLSLLVYLLVGVVYFSVKFFVARRRKIT